MSNIKEQQEPHGNNKYKKYVHTHIHTRSQTNEGGSKHCKETK